MIGWNANRGRGALRASEISGAMDGMLITGQTGFIGGTHVASNLGWRGVDALCAGDLVLTFDHGMQPIVDIQRELLFMPADGVPEAHCPVLIPEGALHNRTDMWLMPEQGLMVESDAAIDALGDPFAVVPAQALIGFKGVRRAEEYDRLEVTTLAFANDEVVYVEGGMLAHCPRPRRILTDMAEPEQPLYDVLNLHDARFLVECLAEEEGLDGFACAEADEFQGIARPTLYSAHAAMV